MNLLDANSVVSTLGLIGVLSRLSTPGTFHYRRLYQLIIYLDWINESTGIFLRFPWRPFLRLGDKISPSILPWLIPQTNTLNLRLQGHSLSPLCTSTLVITTPLFLLDLPQHPQLRPTTLRDGPMAELMAPVPPHGSAVLTWGGHKDTGSL